jgi:hypothetical protein
MTAGSLAQGDMGRTIGWCARWLVPMLVHRAMCAQGGDNNMSEIARLRSGDRVCQFGVDRVARRHVR